MSFLGIDVGTTGCKTTAFSDHGEILASAYEEYDIQRPNPGWAELDAEAVWNIVKRTVTKVTTDHQDPTSIQAISVSSMGEAVVPVTKDRQILGPSILNFDVRGQEYVSQLHDQIENEALYKINGNQIGNHYTLTKLLWMRDHKPELYERADFFLHWSGFVLFMLGGEPVADYSLANRTLLFDLSNADWSVALLNTFQVDRDKLPPVSPSAKPIGTVAGFIADEIGLPPKVALITGAHDQCANAVGCGAIEDGQASFGIGTYICITPVYKELHSADAMIERGLNTEHHAAPDRFVSFIYTPGGALVKWYRDAFAREEQKQAQKAGKNIYNHLFAEVPEDPSPVLVLPHFTPTGPPEFIAESRGVLVGLQLDTSRGEILKGILEGTAYYLKECVEALPEIGIQIENFRVAGGGSQSDAWVQLCADIFERPFIRPRVTEAGTLGAAVIAGVGSGFFKSFQEGVATMVRPERTFVPNTKKSLQYKRRFEFYKQLWPMMRSFLKTLANDPT